MFHFDSLNRPMYGKLHKKVYKAHQLNGIDVLPKKIDRTTFLMGKHDRENGRNPNTLAASSTVSQLLSGVACA